MGIPDLAETLSQRISSKKFDKDNIFLVVLFFVKFLNMIQVPYVCKNILIKGFASKRISISSFSPSFSFLKWNESLKIARHKTELFLLTLSFFC